MHSQESCCLDAHSPSKCHSRPISALPTSAPTRLCVKYETKRGENKQIGNLVDNSISSNDESQEDSDSDDDNNDMDNYIDANATDVSQTAACHFSKCLLIILLFQ
jgi:hypothetical protein